MSDSNHQRAENGRNPLISVANLPEDLLPTVTIPEKRLDAVELAGHERAASHHGELFRHLVGACGEFAVAMYLGQEDRFDTNTYDGGDGGVDLVWQGKKVQVKTAESRQNNPNLLVPTYQSLNSHYYVLVHQLSRQVYRIVGYTDRETVADARVIDLPSIPEARFVPREKLRHFPLARPQ